MRCLKLIAFMLLSVGSAGLLYVPAVKSEASEAEPVYSKKYALLVGINDYTELNDLQYCNRDIQMLRESLIAAGFQEENVVLLHDEAKGSLQQPFRANIEHHLEAILKSVGEHDLIVFAFSGHGVELDGTSYLCPVEAQLETPENTLIPLERVYRQLAACGARQKLLLVDACRNDPRPGGERSTAKPTESIEGFARSLVQPPEGILVLASCKPGQISVEDDKMGHGVFMHFVLHGLRGEADRENGNNNGSVSVFELYRYASLRTKTHVARTRDLKQTPVLRGEITADYEIARISTRAPEVKHAWATVCNNPDMFIKNSPIMQWYQRVALRKMEAMAEEMYGPDSENQVPMTDAERKREKQRLIESIRKRLRRPEAIILCNPSVITADDPKALLAIQRAYAFGVRDDWDGAIAAATEAIRLEPENPFAYLIRGMAYLRKRQEFILAQTFLQMRQDTLGRTPRSTTREKQAMIDAGVEEVIRKVGKLDPEMTNMLRRAQRNPALGRQAIQTVAEKLNKATSLEPALKDFQEIGLTILIQVHQGTKFQIGDTVVANVKGYFEDCDAITVKGDWIWVERAEGPATRKAYVQNNEVHALSYFGQFQLVVQ